jgi:hypothetical protein
MILRLTDGTTTVNLTGGAISLAEPYMPAAPDVSTVEFVAESQEDGGELFEITRRNVTESALVTVTGATVSTVQGLVNGIEELFKQAEEHQRRGVGSRVWVEYRPGSSGDTYRSEILYGKVEPVGETGRAANWADVAIQARVIWRRRFYWEGSLTELALTNGGGSGTGGRTIYNHDDGGTGHDNYVAIDGDDVEGVLPAPIRLELSNTYNVSERDYWLYVNLNAFSYPGSLDHILEAEDAAYTLGSTVASGVSSNGEYETLSWGTDNETLLVRWALSTSLLSACAGNYFRLLARFTGNPTAGIKITPKITFPTGTPITVVGESQEATLNTRELQDLGALQIPPWLVGETSLMGLDLCLYGRNEGGGSLNLDFVQLTALDGWRRLVPRGYGAPYGYRVVDDGLEGNLRIDTGGSSARAGYYIGYGRQIHVWPGRDQRIHVLAANDGGDSEIARTHSVRAYYRPRKLTV